MSQLTHWNPFKSLARVETPATFDDFFRGFGLRPAWRDLDAMPDIRIDVSEDNLAYKVKADIPGMKKENIEVSIEGRQVEIAAETKHETEKKTDTCLYTERNEGRVYRSFMLPTEIDRQKVEAKYDGGVLSLTLPKMAVGQNHRIAVN